MKINARETAQRNGRDGGRSTRMGVTAGLPSARARIDERMTCAKDRKHTSCRLVRRRWRGRAAYTCSAKKAHRQNDAMGHTSAQGTSHIWCPRTATPAGDANGGSMPCSGERRRAKPTHIHGCSVSNNTHTVSTKSRRALSPWCHVALSGRLSGVLSASSVDRCRNVVARRWASW